MKLITMFLLLIVAPCIYAQQSSSAESIFQKYFQQAQVFSAAYPQEKVHLHFDNTSYYCGDTIWFKAYVTQGSENLLNLSYSSFIIVSMILPVKRLRSAS